METRIRYEFTTPVVVATAPEEARVLHGVYIGLPSAKERDVYDLYRMDEDGEPTGEWQAQMGSAVVEVSDNEGVAPRHGSL